MGAGCDSYDAQYGSQALACVALNPLAKHPLVAQVRERLTCFPREWPAWCARCVTIPYQPGSQHLSPDTASRLPHKPLVACRIQPTAQPLLPILQLGPKGAIRCGTDALA